MKATGPTKLSKRLLIARLEKLGRKSGQRLWLDLAERLAKPRRIKISVNLWKLDKMARKFPNKILLVPGKVLGSGALGRPLNVCAEEFSSSAKKGIAETKGKAINLAELIEQAPKASEIIIIK